MNAVHYIGPKVRDKETDETEPVMRNALLCIF